MSSGRASCSGLLGRLVKSMLPRRERSRSMPAKMPASQKHAPPKAGSIGEDQAAPRQTSASTADADARYCNEVPPQAPTLVLNHPVADRGSALNAKRSRSSSPSARVSHRSVHKSIGENTPCGDDGGNSSATTVGENSENDTDISAWSCERRPEPKEHVQRTSDDVKFSLPRLDESMENCDTNFGYLLDRLYEATKEKPDKFTDESVQSCTSASTYGWMAIRDSHTISDACSDSDTMAQEAADVAMFIEQVRGIRQSAKEALRMCGPSMELIEISGRSKGELVVKIHERNAHWQNVLLSRAQSAIEKTGGESDSIRTVAATALDGQVTGFQASLTPKKPLDVYTFIVRLELLPSLRLPRTAAPQRPARRRSEPTIGPSGWSRQ